MFLIVLSSTIKFSFPNFQSNSSYLQHQPICGLGSFLNEPLSLSYSVDSFDLSLLGFDHDDVTIIGKWSLTYIM